MQTHARLEWKKREVVLHGLLTITLILLACLFYYR